MSNFANTLDWLSAFVDRICRVLAFIFFVLMLSFVMVQVVARYGFASPPEWTEEAARYCMIWLGLLGGTVAFRGKKDPVLVKVSDSWPKLARVAARVGRSGAALVFVLPLTYYSFDFLERYSHRVTDTLGINTALVVAIVPIFGAIIALHAIADLFYPRPPESDFFEPNDTET